MHIFPRNSSIAAVVLIAGASLTSGAFAQTAAFNPGQAAGELAGKVSDKLGSQEGIRQNAVNPLTTSGQQMSTISGTTTFNAPLVFCPASRKFMDLSIIPGSTGDITGVYVQQDTDFDSVFDYTYAVPVPVSGVCGNGVISCDPGTWNHCRHFKWVSDPSGKTSLQAAGMQELGGCFCVNNSCGAGLVMNQLGYVLNVLGGGVVGAIQAVNPRWAVSNASTTDTTISYFGQNSDQCSAPAAPMASGTANPEQYYGSGSAMEGASQAEVARQIADPGSSYNAVLSLSAASSSGGNYSSCAIRRSYTVATSSVQTDKDCNGNPTRYLGDAIWTADNGCDNIVSNFTKYDTPRTCDSAENGGACTFQPYRTFCWGGSFGVFFGYSLACEISPYRYSPTLPLEQGQTLAVRMIKTAKDSYQRSSGGFGVMLDDWKEPSGTYLFHWAWPGGDLSWPVGEAYARVTPDINITQTGDHTFYIWSFLNDPLSLWMCSYVDIRKYWCIVKDDALSAEMVNNTCSSYESNPDCRLKDETIDGVKTFVNYNPTGLIPVSSCRTFSGEVESFNVCEDWWEKDRTYFCRNRPSYDTSIMKERSANIANTTASGSGVVSYQDKTPASGGGWNYASNTASVDTTGGSSACMTACKTRKPATNTQASLSGTTAQTNVSTSSWEFFYKTCRGSACPVGTGEEVVIDCQCISEFAEAATIMETMNQAAKDLICSNGAQQ